MTHLETLLILNRIPSCHAHTARILCDSFEDLSTLFRPDTLAYISNKTAFGKQIAKSYRQISRTFDPIREIETAFKEDISIITFQDARYPRMLLETYDPPVLLYVKGSPDCLEKDLIAMVGSRTASFYGKEMAHTIAYELASHGIPVVRVCFAADSLSK